MDARIAVEVFVETQDLRDGTSFHHGDVHRIAGRDPLGPENDELCTLDVPLFYGKDLVNNASQRIERRLNRITPPESNIPVQNLLKDFCIGDQPLFILDTRVDQSSSFNPVRIGGSDQVHRNVGV